MPPPGIGAGSFFFGSSATMASVVISSPATEAASWRAVLPDQVAKFAGLGVEAKGGILALEDLADDDRAVADRVLGNLTRRSLDSLDRECQNFSPVPRQAASP